jgi:hypothetical protein
MTAISDGLPNGGRTDHFQVTYDDSLSPADGLGRASHVQAYCEADLALIQSWFPGVDFLFSYPIELRIMNDTGGAEWHDAANIELPFGFSPTVRISPGSGTRAETLRYLAVTEITEMFMASQDKGWYESPSLLTNADEGSKGEGLSRFLGIQFQIANGLGRRAPNDYGVTHKWLNGWRDDYVTYNPDDTNPDECNGCTTAYLFYLHDQLGKTIQEIVNAGSDTLNGVYQKLTGLSDGWTPFIDLVNLHYPKAKGRSYSLMQESPFPVPELQDLNTPGTITCGYEGDATITLTWPAPAELEVQLSSDYAAIVQVPVKVPVPAQGTTVNFKITTLPIAGPFAPKKTAIHAAYAGKTLSADVTLYPPLVSKIELDKDTIKVGETALATVTLGLPSKMGTVDVDLLSLSPGFVTIPSPPQLKIPPEQSTGQFTVTTPDIEIPFKTAHCGIEAKYAGSSATAYIMVKPKYEQGLLRSVTLSPKSVQGGMVSHGQVELEEPVSKPTEVLLKALDPVMTPQGPLPRVPGSPSSSAHVPSSKTIQAGRTTATFLVTTIPGNWPHDRRIVQIEARSVFVRYATLTID